MALILFLISVAIYINQDMGVSPYDGLPIIITEKLKADKSMIGKTILRILWDGSALMIGVIAGNTPAIGHILMVLFLGPAISFVGKLINRYEGRSNN